MANRTTTSASRTTMRTRVTSAGRAMIGIESTALTVQRWHHYEVW